MVRIKLIEEIHNHFYREVTLNKNYSLLMNDSHVRMIKKFISWLDEDFPNWGKDFTINYFESGWNYWYDQTHLKYGLSSVKLSWLIGQKAYNRWKKIKDQDYTFNSYKRKLKIDTKINLSDLRYNDNDEINFNDLDDHEEAIKKQYHNTDIGLYMCLEDTTLYNHKSKYCMLCKYKEDCKNVLKKQFPKLNKSRNYG